MTANTGWARRLDRRSRWITLRHGELLAGFFVVCAALMWPLDALMFDTREQLAAAGMWRTGTIALNLFALVVARWLRTAPRYVYVTVGALAVANACGVGAFLGAVGTGGDLWLPASYAVPLAVLPLLMPLWHRAVLTSAVSVACVAVYLLVADVTVDAQLASTLLTLGMVTAMSVALGHMYYRVVRDDYTRREDLAQQLRDRTDGLRRLLSRFDDAQRDERRRISHELHDELAQALTALRLEVSLALRTTDKDSDGYGVLVRVDGLIDELLNAKNRLLAALRPAMVEQVGLAGAIVAHAREVAARAGLEVDVAVEPERMPVDPETATAAFRTVQEALTNVVKHANATKVCVTVHYSDRGVEVEIADDGAGFDPDAIAATSFGLLGIRERAGAIGGRVNIDTEPGHGTIVSVELPRGAAAH